MQKALEQQIDSVHEQMVEIQALIIEKGDQPNDVGKWSLDIEKQVIEYEQITEDVRGMVKSLHEEALLEGKWEEEKVEEEKHRRRRAQIRRSEDGD